MFRLFPTTSHIHEPLRILIISNNEKPGIIDSQSNSGNIGELINAIHSNEIQDKLKILLQQFNQDQIEYQIEFMNQLSASENDSLVKTADVINTRKADIVLVSDDMKLSAIDLAEQCVNSNTDNKSKFYLLGNASVHINQMIENTNFTGAIGINIDLEKDSLLKKSYGQANQATNIPNTIDTKFNVASISKMFTSVGIAKLVEDGKLKYDDYAANFLPESTPNHIKEYFSKNNITVNELLTHTSGLSQIYFEVLLKSEMMSYNSLNNFVTVLESENVLSTNLAKRGQFQYSNINYLLLGCIIEQASGKNYYSYMKDEIFGAEMKNTLSTNEAGPSFSIGYTELQSLEHGWLKNIKFEDLHLQEVANELYDLLEIYKVKMPQLIQIYQTKLAEIDNGKYLESFKLEFKKEINDMFKLVDDINVKIEELKIQSNVNKEDFDKLTNLFAESSFTGAPFLLFSLINNLSVAQPGGYWRSTIDDLLTFSNAVWSKKILNNPQILTDNQISIGSSRPVDPSYYGKGVCIWGEGITLCVGHDGAGPGSRATVRQYPNAGITLATVSNVENDNADALKNRLSKYLVESRLPESNIQLFDHRINPDTNMFMLNNVKNITAVKLHNKLQIQSLMQASYVPGISIATVSQGEIHATSLGYADNQTNLKVDSDTQFWACSLSKPVFAYLILKLIKDGTLPENFLDEKLPWDEGQHGPRGERNLLTPRMILSHQTGLPNEGPANFKFNPDEGFCYSGEGYVYLQKIIEEHTKKSLEKLAQAKLFVPLEMTRTTFLFPEAKNIAKTHDEAMTPNPLPKQHANDNNAAGSLHSTASDYARFLMACMNDEDFIDLITPQIGYHLCLMSETEPKQGELHVRCSSEGLECKIFGLEDINTIPWGDLPKEFPHQFTSLNEIYRFLPDIIKFTSKQGHTPQINSMEKDTDAKKKGLDAEILKPIDWGLGFGLQKNENGKVIAAFHWGHGPGARTFFAINLEHPQSAVVYLTNSENGLALAKDIMTPAVGDITPIMKFLSDKYGYEDIHSLNWKEYHEHLITGVKAETEGNFDLAIESYKEAEKIWQVNSARKWFSCVLMSNKEPILESMQPHTLVMLLEDQMLTAYWIENGKMKNVSFPVNSVPEIAKLLPPVNTSSNDKKLIEAIILQYGCTSEKNAELLHRIVIAEEANKKDDFDIKILKKLTGEYGPLIISVVNESKLQINDGSPNSPRDLKWINNDTLLDVDGGKVMLKFKCNESQNPISLSCQFPSGANVSFHASKNTKSAEPLSVRSQSIFSHSQSSTSAEKEDATKIWVKRPRGG